MHNFGNDLIADIDENCVTKNGIDSRHSEFSSVMRNDDKFGPLCHEARPDILPSNTDYTREKLVSDLYYKTPLHTANTEPHCIETNRNPHLFGRNNSKTLDMEKYPFIRSNSRDRDIINKKSIFYHENGKMSIDGAALSTNTCAQFNKTRNSCIHTATSNLTCNGSTLSNINPQDVSESALIAGDIELPFDVPTNFPPPPVRKKVYSLFTRTAVKSNRKQSSKYNSQKRFFTSRSKPVTNGKVNTDRSSNIIPPPIKFSSENSDRITPSPACQQTRPNTNNTPYNQVKTQHGVFNKSIPISSTPLNGFQLLKSQHYNEFRPDLAASSVPKENYFISNSYSCSSKGGISKGKGENSFRNQNDQMKTDTQNRRINMITSEGNIYDKIENVALISEINTSDISDYQKPVINDSRCSLRSRQKVNNPVIHIRNSCPVENYGHIYNYIQDDNPPNISNLLLNYQSSTIDKIDNTYSPIHLSTNTTEAMINRMPIQSENSILESIMSCETIPSNLSSPESVTPAVTPTQLVSLMSPRHLSQPHINTVPPPIVSSFKYNNVNSTQSRIDPSSQITKFSFQNVAESKLSTESSSLLTSDSAQCVILHDSQSPRPINSPSPAIKHPGPPESSVSSILFPIHSPVTPSNGATCLFQIDATRNSKSELSNDKVVLQENLKTESSLDPLYFNASTIRVSQSYSSDFMVPPKCLKVDPTAVATSVTVCKYITCHKLYFIFYFFEVTVSVITLN